MAEWYSIEVLNGATSARDWADEAIDVLVDEALGHGAVDWELHHHGWGCILELSFPAEADFAAFREAPGVLAALERVPDPLTGLLVYRGRGNSSGSRRPRRPLPLSGSGAAALPLPDEDLFALVAAELVEAWPRQLQTLGG